jgi:hypothetical protein
MSGGAEMPGAWPGGHIYRMRAGSIWAVRARFGSRMPWLLDIVGPGVLGCCDATVGTVLLICGCYACLPISTLVEVV